MGDHCKVNVVTIATFVSALFAIAVSVHYFWPKLFPPPDVEVTLATPPTCRVKSVGEGRYQYLISACIGLGARKGQRLEVDSVWVETPLGNARLLHRGTMSGGFQWPIAKVWEGTFLIGSDKKVTAISGCVKARTSWGVGSSKFKIEKVSCD